MSSRTLPAPKPDALYVLGLLIGYAVRAAFIAFGLVFGALAGLMLALALGLTLNVDGASKGVSVCNSVVSGGVYVDTRTGAPGVFQGCDF